MMTMMIIVSKRCVFEDETCSAVIVVVDGKIANIIRRPTDNDKRNVIETHPNAIFKDFGNDVVMPGVVDSHVHADDPGRTHWEGFWTATRAAAAGGCTTIVDMPLNSIPPTTTVANLEEKVKCAREKAFVDVAFWGGVIPGNKKELKPMIAAGVVGFKCFLIPSATEEFPHVSLDDVREALEELKSTNSVLAFHAELECQCNGNSVTDNNDIVDPSVYDNYLSSRPASMEVRAIEKVVEACRSSGVRCHIVHLSAAEALDLVADAKKNGLPLTAETCHHYLTIDSSQVPNGATEYKCCPPIRNLHNQTELWRALKSGTLDMIVSDHSPCTDDMKIKGDFVAAWGGISSLQFGLSISWTGAREREISFSEISKFLSANPAKLCGLDGTKGKFFVGADADFVVWQPEEKYQIKKADILHKNKLTAYESKELFGRVKATYLRGRCIYDNGKVCDKPVGHPLLRNK